MSNVHLATLGWALMLGLLGLLLPVLPGIPLLVAALFLLSREYDWARRLLARARQWFPAVAARTQQVWHRVNSRACKDS